MRVKDVTSFRTCWLAERRRYHLYVSTTCYLLTSISVYSYDKMCTWEFSVFPWCFFFSPQKTNLQLPPCLSALALACQHFLLAAIRSLPRFRYLRTSCIAKVSVTHNKGNKLMLKQLLAAVSS